MGRPRKYEYESDDPAERKRMSSAAYYAQHREQIRERRIKYREQPGVKERIRAQQYEYRQRDGVKERIKADNRAATRLYYKRMKLDPERYEQYLAKQREYMARYRAERKARDNAE